MPPTPVVPPPPAGTTILSGLTGILDQTQGNRLTPATTPQYLDLLAQHIGAYGNASVSQQMSRQYFAQTTYNNNGVPFTYLNGATQGINETVQTPTYVIQGYGQGRAMALRFTPPLAQAQVFNYADSIRIRNAKNITIWTTDQVALFQRDDGQRQQILKVAYQTPNPAMELYEVSLFGSAPAAQGQGPLLHIVLKYINSSFQYPTQTQPPLGTPTGIPATVVPRSNQFNF